VTGALDEERKRRIILSNIERVSDIRYRFLRTVYDLAEGIPSHPIQGEDVAKRLGLDLLGQEFHGLAYFHQKAKNIEALETNWGRFIITVKGISEVENRAMPESRQERRSRFLRALYDLGEGHRGAIVAKEEIAARLGMDADDPNDDAELTNMARYFEERGYARRLYAGYAALSITSKGIDEVEGNRPQSQTISNVFNVSGHLYNPVIGTHNTANFSGEFDFTTIEQRIETEAGADKEELRELVNEVRSLLEQDGALNRGFLSRFNAKLKEYDWLANAVAGWLLNFSTRSL
jgi:hypothetical protein